ncbi:hypothetical protein GQ55_1G099200 [Panicum hallii var. hallii]|uniref:Uncharacterized protein n=1 Tax=Panicum hallii var. hallii TaxID=1504633 RepID=A0A2T7F448_9POAL|nr:hypothetical protein GQ55_1G099200 [Panicum hallii var. hallii]
MRSSCKILVAYIGQPAKAPDQRIKSARPARTRNFVSHPLASRKPAAAAVVAVDIPAPPQSTSPSSRQSPPPHAAHGEVARGPDPNGPTTVPPLLQRRLGDAWQHSNVSTLWPPPSPLDSTNQHHCLPAGYASMPCLVSK